VAIRRINEQIAYLQSILKASNYGIVPTPPLTSTMTITTQLSLKDINLSVVREMMNHDGVQAILAKHASDFVMEVKTERQGMYNSCAVSIEELDDDDPKMMADVGEHLSAQHNKRKGKDKNKNKDKNKINSTQTKKKKSRGQVKPSQVKSKNKSIKRFGANGEPVNAKSLRVYTNGTLHIVGCVNTMECVKYAKIMCEILCSLFSRSDISVVDATINMINTNFKVPGYCIKPQDAFQTLHQAASSRSNIKVTYHPKNHAAVQVKFYPSTRGKPATIMLFHTGNILITGFVRWSELKEAYIFITSFLAEHIEDVGVPCS
jgi:TATA-box binding protein (TBP) (component of TFIID and TFIIIB)